MAEEYIVSASHVERKGREGRKDKDRFYFADFANFAFFVELAPRRECKKVCSP
jgi:hypothetical protein